MKSIKQTMIIYSVILVGILMLSIGLVGKMNVGNLESMSINEIRNQRMTGYDDAVQYQVQNVITLLDTLYQLQKSGKLTEQQAQEQAKILIKGLRYGDAHSGYFWIDNTDYTLVAHPILPQNEGQNRYELKDQNGVMIIQEIMKVVTKDANGGFSEFYFTKADGVTIKPKRTYSMMFKPWNWIISSGNYYDDINTELDSISNQFISRFSKLYLDTAVVFLVLVIVAFCFAFIFAARFSKPITETADVLQEMEHGNLTLRLPPSSQNNEIGHMRKMVNNFTATINKMVATTRDNINSLNTVAGELDTNSTYISAEIKQITLNAVGLSRHAKVQRKTVKDTISTMNTMNELISDLSHRIEDQNNAVSQSSAAIEEMIANINSITQNIDRFGTSFNQLSTNSTSGNEIISKVIQLVQSVSAESEGLLDTNKVIQDVATQTNLLAMNAAIEAAHAGVAGKGFAVVAEEIRKLSESTTKQSHSIKETLTGVIKNIHAVSDASDSAGKVFSGIVQQISDDDLIITEIRRAMEEQSSGSQQIEEALGNIRETTQAIILSSDTMNHGVDNVEKQISELDRLADGLQSATAEIEQSTQKILEASKTLKSMASDNRSFAGKLSSETDQFTV